LVAFLALGGCSGPTEVERPLKLRIDPELLRQELPSGPRREATEARLRRESERFAEGLFPADPMPKDLPEEATTEAATPTPTGKPRLVPPAWAQGVPEPPRTIEHDLPRPWPIEVLQGERLQLLARWAGTTPDAVRADNPEVLGGKRGLRIGDRVQLIMSPNQKVAFDQARERFSAERLQAYFSTRQVARVVVHRVKKGEVVAQSLKRYGDVPLWLLAEFNQMNFRKVKAGDEVLIPVVEPYERGQAIEAVLEVVDETGAPLAQDRMVRVERHLNQGFLDRARLAIDDSHVFERGAAAPRVAALGAQGILPEYRPRLAPPTQAPQEVEEPAVPALKPRIVVVKPGETLGALAGWGGLPVKAIVEANPGLDPDRLRVGMKLNLPLTDAGYADFVSRRAGKETAVEEPLVVPLPVASPLTEEAPGVPMPEPQARAKRVHVVGAGETASLIALHNGTTLGELKKLNLDKDLDRLRIGQRLVLE
jgi:LysM repeat protein